MGLWQVNADTLAGGRFLVSALAETTACLFALHTRTAGHPGERAWLDRHLGAYEALLAADPVTARLVGAAHSDRWIADFLTPAPTGVHEPAFDREIQQVRAMSAEHARQDLRMALGGPLPAELDGCHLPERAADLLTWVWRHTVLPDWERRRRIIEADIVARSGRLGQGGWAAVLDAMRPGMRWLGGSRLQVNPRDHPPREVSGARLFFVPVTPGGHGWVCWATPPPCDRYAVVHPCSGTLADAGRTAVPEALGRLIGPARAQVLVLLDTPKSTTQLVALTGQGLGSVGRHLKVLFDAGLAGRRRSGRSVLYYRTRAGEVLVEGRSDG
ncbi:ArsR/SmtB family transcription factor [Streptomyces sulfonofaciens]|uniref:ArsR/SmtB family transcription factor n=1 Tax=Streptomyces sulfonofaciens TaxID=68272 RepID=UPI00167587A1|nr:winged helix-turn-helix domain-containing protein [Streptomyces sulfonofaciens]